MPLPNTPIDGPPPSPATDPAAAREVGMPIDQLTTPMQIQPQGPDLSGLNTLGQKLIEGMLALAQAAPVIARDMDMAVATMQQALGKLGSQAGMGGSGSMPPRVAGSVVTQAGAQFPGSQAGGRPY